MGLAENGPFLREGEEPALVLSAQVGNVLHHARFLVVGLLDQEGVVLDALCGPCVGVLGTRRQAIERQGCRLLRSRGSPRPVQLFSISTGRSALS